MIHLITGLPGAGKSFYSVSKIVELAAAGETIYSDIKDLDVPSVLPIPDDLDWQNLPDGSHVFYDEAQKQEIFKAKGRETISNNPILSGLETHRHRGFELYFITQDAKFLHKHILSLVGEHTNISRPLGLKFPAVYQWGQYQPSPDSAASKKKADAHFNFALKKSIFKYYKSATIHTHGLQWKKLLKMAFMPILALFAVLYVAMGSNTFLSPHNKPASPQSSPTASSNAPASPVGTTGDNSATDQSAAEAHELTRPAQIVSSSAGDCYAKNSYGELLDISADKCNLYAEHPNLLSGSRIAQQNLARNDYATASTTQQPAAVSSL